MPLRRSTLVSLWRVNSHHFCSFFHGESAEEAQLDDARTCRIDGRKASQRLTQHNDVVYVLIRKSESPHRAESLVRNCLALTLGVDERNPQRRAALRGQQRQRSVPDSPNGGLCFRQFVFGEKYFRERGFRIRFIYLVLSGAKSFQGLSSTRFSSMRFFAKSTHDAER